MRIKANNKFMIKKIVLSALAIMMVLGVSAQKIKGSDTVLPLAQQEAETYMKENRNAKLTVSGGGSGVEIGRASCRERV